MGKEIREFNNKMKEYLMTFTDGLDKDKFDIIKSCQLSFDDGVDKNDLVTEIISRDMDVPDDFIAYYWTEFIYKENAKKYKFTMYFKDFDHNTGNIHVIPGMFQFWEEENEKEEKRFLISRKVTSNIEVKKRGGFEKPYCGHGGGRTYIEEGWKPCVANEHGSKFFNIILSKDCEICMIKKINENFLQTISDPAGFMHECKHATESKLIY
nr:hypothetical protein [Lachnospiraceae bacterium]